MFTRLLRSELGKKVFIIISDICMFTRLLRSELGKKVITEHK